MASREGSATDFRVSDSLLLYTVSYLEALIKKKTSCERCHIQMCLKRPDDPKRY